MRNYHEQAMGRLAAVRNRLVDFTAGCRVDMHEADEQGIGANVTGAYLDNAMGTTEEEHGAPELVVTLFYEDEGPGDRVEERFNLADLIALARRASL